MKTLAVCVIALALAGCATVSPERAALLNPVRLDTSGDLPGYNSALAKLRAQAAAQPVSIPSYVDEGIGLIDGNCSDWLAKIDDTQRAVDSNRQNTSVLAAGALALASAFRAPLDLLTGAGIGLTAYSGLSDNFNAATFIAPSMQGVSARVIDLMTSYAAQLRTDAPTLTLAAAQSRLRVYEGLCRFTTIRALVNGSLQQTTASVTPAGALTTVPTPAAVSAANVASSYVKDDSGARIVAWWLPAGVVNVTHDLALKLWMTDNGITASIPFLAHSQLYAAARAKAVADLKIPAAP